MFRSLALALLALTLVACSEEVREGTPVDRSLLSGHQGRWSTCINDGESSTGIELTISGNVISSDSFTYYDSACRFGKTSAGSSTVTVMEHEGIIYFEANGEYWDLTLSPSSIKTGDETYYRI